MNMDRNKYMIRNSENIANDGEEFLGIQVLKTVVSALCIGEAYQLYSRVQVGMYESLIGLALVSVGIGLLFGIYRGCRWCELLSWMSWICLPLVVVYFFTTACLHWTSDPTNPFKQGSLLNHAVRYCAPFVLVLWIGFVAQQKGSQLPEIWCWVLRIAAAATFIGHGLNALRGSPAHVALIQLTGQNLFSYTLREDIILQWLRSIGTMDILLAVTLLFRKWKAVAMWMAVWGLVTAASRLTAYGVEKGWSLTAIRIGNGGVPFVVWWIWKYGKSGENSLFGK